MKTLLLTLVIIAVVFPINATAIQRDQALHGLGGFAISSTLSQLILSHTKLRNDRWAAFFVPVITTTFGCAMYEFANPGDDSFDDAVWCMGGAALGSGISVKLEFD